MEIGISHLNHVLQEQRGLKNAVLSQSPFRFRVDPSGTEEGTEHVADLNLETLAGIIGKGPLGPRMWEAKEYGNMQVEPRTTGGSVSIVTDGRNGVEVYLALGLNGSGVYGLLITGCDTSVISRRVIPNELLKPTTQKLYAANGTEMPCSGKWNSLLTLWLPSAGIRI